MSDDELFGNNDADNIELKNHIINTRDNEDIRNQNDEISDLDENDIFGSEDFFGANNKYYSNTYAYSKINPPIEKGHFSYQS
jgi:hypothetical protein